MTDSSYTPAHRSVFRAIGDFFSMVTESNWRVREAQRLHEMNDAQLAARGLRREDIARHVFRDVFYI